MNEKLREALKIHMDKGTIFEGRVKVIEYDESIGKNVLILDLKDLVAKIPDSEADSSSDKNTLLRLLGAKVNFKITDILEDGTIIGSRKVVKEEKRKILVEKLENNEHLEGTITRILRYGAYLDIDGTQVVLKNVDFATDYTTIAEKHKIGDKILVKLNKINANNKIQVEAVNKAYTPSSVKFEDFKEGQVVYGKIRSIKPDACFVGLIPNLDALASIPEFVDFPIEEGMSVLIQIKKVFSEEKKIRGKIIRVFQYDSDILVD